MHNCIWSKHMRVFAIIYFLLLKEVGFSKTGIIGDTGATDCV